MKLFVGLILSVLLSGCQSLTYYSQAVNGQVDIWSRQRDIEVVLADPETDPLLRARLESAVQARRFASDELGLPDNISYTRFVDLERDFVVWNVVAAPRYSVEPLNYCFPVVGCVSYRGYFDKQDAAAWAEQQRQSGLDVYMGGVSAYSTLGWFDDPLLNTMLSRSDAAIAALIFHELAHQKIFIKGDTRFNESFATAVEEIGLTVWAQTQDERENVMAYLERQKQRGAVFDLLLEARDRLRIAYEKNSELGDSRLAELKRVEFDRLRRQYAALRAAGEGTPGFDKFFESELNNASLALFGAYHGWVSAFKKVFDQSGGDWEVFYARVEDLAGLAKNQRDMQLERETK